MMGVRQHAHVYALDAQLHVIKQIVTILAQVAVALHVQGLVIGLVLEDVVVIPGIIDMLLVYRCKTHLYTN